MVGGLPLSLAAYPCLPAVKLAFPFAGGRMETTVAMNSGHGVGHLPCPIC
jgi:hypothetical protein